MPEDLVLEIRVETLIDGQAYAWSVGGDFAWGDGAPLCPQTDYPLEPGLGPDGYRILELPPGLGEQARESVAAYLHTSSDRLEAYHEVVDEAGHIERIQRSRELRFADLGLDAQAYVRVFEAALSVKLDPMVESLGRDHVQLRINRPGSTDYNPPHRDGSLPVWRRSLNAWIPIAGVNPLTSLSIVPGSQRLAEIDCWQTPPGGATIAGKPYRVPAIARTREGPLRMVRAPVRLGQALVFTPFLIHGLAVNFSEHTRMALEFRFQIV